MNKVRLRLGFQQKNVQDRDTRIIQEILDKEYDASDD